MDHDDIISTPSMAGHEVFHDATVRFTDDFVNSLPRKLLEYSNVIQKIFKLTLNECGKFNKSQINNFNTANVGKNTTLSCFIYILTILQDLQLILGLGCLSYC